ncbi:hypothetical protein [uncultured Anaerococcus sp.]|uniref:hypothetical protein n=1 Tax=uncultured Anaerococcus sp. TaxID=293428 RepID=UPI0028038FEE|nr:hypothetical protein [uncultured Anaerococcus sp.]
MGLFGGKNKETLIEKLRGLGLDAFDEEDMAYLKELSDNYEAFLSLYDYDISKGNLDEKDFLISIRDRQSFIRDQNFMMLNYMKKMTKTLDEINSKLDKLG